MNGQMMNYKRYYESLEKTPEPAEVSDVVAIDYKGLVRYAASKGVEPCNLPESERNMFIISRNVAVV